MALAMVNSPLGGSSGPSTDWQLGCSELKQRGGHLLQTGQWSDCSFLVGVEPHQMTFKAHKLVLASASPVFEAMFFGGMAEGDGPIKILDVEPDAFKTLLLYIYTDKTIISSFDKACSIYYAAKKYMLPYLVKECTWFISLNLDAKNVCRAYELAQLFDENLMLDKCLKIMEHKTKEIVTDESFLEANLKTLDTLLSLEHLDIENELDLFNALERYAKVHLKSGQYKRRSGFDLSSSGCECSMKRMKLSSDHDDTLNCTANEMNSVISHNNSTASRSSIDHGLERHEETGELVPRESPTTPTYGLERNDSTTKSLSSVDEHKSLTGLNSSICSQDGTGDLDVVSVRAAIGKIRFLTLTATQFALGPARSPLLSESEAFAVLMNILSSAADVPMPRGFSTSRLLRNQQSISPEVPEAQSEAVFRFTVLNFKSRRRSVESSVGAKDKSFAVNVVAELSLLPHALSPPRPPTVRARIDRIFTHAEAEWGVERFVSRQTVLSPELGLLRNNAITLEARLLASEPAEPRPL